MLGHSPSYRPRVSATLNRSALRTEDSRQFAGLSSRFKAELYGIVCEAPFHKKILPNDTRTVGKRAGWTAAQRENYCDI